MSVCVRVYVCVYAPTRSVASMLAFAAINTSKAPACPYHRDAADSHKSASKTKRGGLLRVHITEVRLILNSQCPSTFTIYYIVLCDISIESPFYT